MQAVLPRIAGRHLARVTVTSIGVCLLGSLVLYVFSRDASTSVAVSFLMATYCFLFASNQETAGNLFHPYSWFLLRGGIINFGLPAVVIAIDPGLVMGPGLTTEQMAMQHVAVVSVMIALFFIIYHVGYMLPIGRKLAQTVPLFAFPKPPARQVYIATAMALYGVGWFARIAAFAAGSHHMNPDLGQALTLVSSLLNPLSTFATLSFVVLLWDKFSHAKTAAALLSPLVVLLIGLEVLLGLIEGSRSQIVIPLMLVAVVYNFTFGRIKWRHLIFGTVVLVVVLLPAATLYRYAYYGSLDEDGASIEGARQSIEAVSETGGEQFSGQITVVLARLSSALEGAVAVYDKVPAQVDFARGETFFPSAFLNLVPRFFWPEKPVLFPGRDFAQIFWNMEVGETFGTNMEISSVGESYYNFGWLGLLLAIPLGVILRFFTERWSYYARLEPNNAARTVFALFAVPAIGVFHYYPANLLRGALVYMLYLALLNHAVPRLLRPRSVQ